MNDSSSRKCLIIAVFGGRKDSSTLDLAEHLGESIASHGHILLTGGDECNRTAVKNMAICGAVNAGASSLWIGVERAPLRRSTGTPQDRSFVIKSHLGHQRNYVEACMCDAAICLEGGDGTLSELVCALSLQRPVALVGDSWKETLDLDDHPPRGITRALEATAKRFKSGSTNQATLPDNLIGVAQLKNRFQFLGRYKYYDSGTSCQRIVSWIAKSARKQVPLPGHLPQVACDAVLVREYEKWLQKRCG